MKVLSLDYGEKRVGLALGDTETKLALPYGVLERLSDETLVVQLQQIVVEEGVEVLLVGEPLGVSGQPTAQTEACRAFAALLREQSQVKVVLFDERFTSQRADAAGASGGKVRGRDELAAMFLLQDYLDRQGA
jgi:putative Holliday junction resolvase